MKKLINKKSLIIITILALFIFAVIININSNQKETASKEEGTKTVSVLSNGDYYTAFRESRENTRQKELEYLEAIINTDGTDEETLKEANEQKLDIVSCMESEMVVENAIKAKGFMDAAVTFHNGDVNVVVDAEELNDSQVAQILDIVMRQTGEPAEDINISVRR